ncbi:Glutamyl-tRNA(Gln) synthetase [hydrothermal vent metagenome]|uniref:glutamate--tRNA ligase n=1 Tax=hydrothermal vent metagenome TaxID=652676 RepID=A0A3B0Y366_9ZZZZ
MKTRFAPSPTGYIHLGNVRTALFNWLCAQSEQGSFLLRIEDTDEERSEAIYVDALKQDLLWLGLDWQEGPKFDRLIVEDVGSNPVPLVHDKGPYFQSQRNDIYDDYFTQLIKSDKAYPCFCSQEELAYSRKAQRTAGHAPRYAGTCAALSAEEVEQKCGQGLNPSLRFRVPHSGRIGFEDHVRGQQDFECSDIGDFIIRRSTGAPAFFFSNAVDDALMNVTHVFRGEDHLTNTPRQKLILEALALRIPEYAHISLIVGSDGTPLSKRHGSMSVAELRDKGYIPIGVLNYLARLGHHYANDDFMDEATLAKEFDIKHLGKAPARFQTEQLMHWQKEAVMRLTDKQVWQWISISELEGISINALVADDARDIFIKTVRDNLVMPQDALSWASSLFSNSGQFDSAAADVMTNSGADFFTQAVVCMSSEPANFKEFSKAVGTATGCKGKHLFMPLRAALTGENGIHGWDNQWQRGPQMADVFALLSKEVMQRRLELASQL